MYFYLMSNKDIYYYVHVSAVHFEQQFYLKHFWFLFKEYNYQEHRCQHVIEAMKKCCSKNSAINTELCLGFKEELEQRKAVNTGQ